MAKNIAKDVHRHIDDKQNKKM
ncbi:hypothetical protein PCC21_036800 [Pectobacterium carotovorum subsp. carotovorum PCC21]|nr:hypothetical protein PCC21_036800 [Pectobacterium carotovorum subsp. carotovorum PCC21]